MELRIKDKVDFTLSPVGEFKKGNYLRGTVIGFTLGKFVKIDSPTFTKRSGLPSICVQRNCIRPHTESNTLRYEKEIQAERDTWLASYQKPKQKNKKKSN